MQRRNAELLTQPLWYLFVSWRAWLLDLSRQIVQLAARRRAESVVHPGRRARVARVCGHRDGGSPLCWQDRGLQSAPPRKRLKLEHNLACGYDSEGGDRVRVRDQFLRAS